MKTGEMATYVGKDPATGERIMAVSSPMIYSSGEVIGVLRYVTSMKIVDRQLTFVALAAIAAGCLLFGCVPEQQFLYSFYPGAGGGDYGDGKTDRRRQLRGTNSVQI